MSNKPIRLSAPRAFRHISSGSEGAVISPNYEQHPSMRTGPHKPQPIRFCMSLPPTDAAYQVYPKHRDRQCLALLHTEAEASRAQR